MNNWTLDPRLARDSVELAMVGAIQVRAMAGAPWPWLLLIPHHPDAVELFDLPSALQLQLGQLTVHLAERMKAEFAADKINIGALGNVVPQLHVHVIARRHGDPGWPGPVWGRMEADLTAEQIETRLLRLLALVNQPRSV